MKKEIRLFDGKKIAKIDYALFTCYELYVHRFTEHTPEYFSHVLELTEEMSGEELSEKLSEALYEDIYMMTVMEDELVVAMRATLNGAEKVSVDDVEAELKQCKLLEKEKYKNRGILLTIQAKENPYIETDLIKKCLACLYKSLKCIEGTLWIDKNMRDNLVQELEVIIGKTSLDELENLLNNFVNGIFGVIKFGEVLDVQYD